LISESLAAMTRGRAPRRRAAGAALALLLLALPALSGKPAKVPLWNCYDPKPGHPTPEEKTAFVQLIGAYAQEAERASGTPAAGLTALAAYESGFGWTHNALEANNLFGYKHHGTEPYPAHTLAGQPASDPNDRYVAFPDWRTGVLFVADQLSCRERYRGVTARYRADLVDGVPIRSAVDRWVEGIAAAGYCPDPGYPALVKGYLADYHAPSRPKDQDHSLYGLSPAPALMAAARN